MNRPLTDRRSFLAAAFAAGSYAALAGGPAALANSLYMFPRADGVILGGTFEAGNWSMDADEATTTRIIEGNAQIAKGLKGSRQ